MLKYFSKDIFCGIIGAVGSWIAYMLGGWDTALQTLCVMMAVDFCLGLIVAGVFHKSKNTENGRLESNACWKGLLRKGVSLLVVLVAVQIDNVIGTQMIIRNGVIIAFIANEALSIIENAGLCGVPIPAILIEAIEMLKKKADEEKLPENDKEFDL